jgi:hypothetical protein
MLLFRISLHILLEIPRTGLGMTAFCIEEYPLNSSLQDVSSWSLFPKGVLIAKCRLFVSL